MVSNSKVRMILIFLIHFSVDLDSLFNNQAIRILKMQYLPKLDSSSNQFLPGNHDPQSKPLHSNLIFNISLDLLNFLLSNKVVIF